MTDDQCLLTDYRRGRPGAFRELVERHAGLVWGAAWRVTGDRTLAEEAVQDVFCLLAKKSAAIAAHPSVAGWLHRTAVNVARDLVRRRAAHERKLAQFAAEAAPAGADDDARPPEWDEIDAAIDRLPRDERAVVVLRFFEELDHAAIARRLGISEAAARKRLSRGLARLQKTIAAPVTSLAVAAPAPLVASVAAQAPPLAPPAGFFTTLTLMTQKQLAATAALVLAGGGLAWFGAAQWQENARLREELATARDAASRRTADTPPRPVASGADTKEGNSSGGAEALRAELAAEVARRTTAERELAALRAETDPLRDQVVVAYGKVGEIGSTLGSLFTEARALVDLEKAGQLDTPENQIRMGKFIEKAASISGLSREIVGFEDKPEEGSRFVAAAYGAVFGLNEQEQAKVAEFFTTTLADAKEKKFTLSNLPERGSAEFEPWLERRWEYFGAQRAALRATIPEAKQAEFDSLVEKGGYGFKNLVLKGSPLMFSLGGDPR